MSRPERVAVGFDGSRDAEGALRWAAELAAALGADLSVVHAVGLLEHAGMSKGMADEGVARRIAEAAGVDPARLHWRAVDGDPSAVLLREAAAGADILVVGTRGAGEHPGSLLGSTSMSLAERAPVPLVIVPRPAGEA